MMSADICTECFVATIVVTGYVSYVVFMSCIMFKIIYHIGGVIYGKRK